MISSNIRVPEDIWQTLGKIAMEEERSINSEIIYIIKKYIEEYKKNEQTNIEK